MTNQRAHRTNQILKDVEEGKISGEAGCLKLLKKGLLNSNNRLPSSNDEESKAVLRSFTKLHMTFFDRPALVGPNAVYTRVTKDIYDEQSSALFYTKALLGTSNIQDVLKGSNDLEGVRSMGRNKDVGYSSNINKSLFTYRSGKNKPKLAVTFVETGELTGVQDSRELIHPNASAFSKSSNNILDSLGGGLLGARSYLLRSLPASNGSAANGANKMNRPWANTVLKDFLCRGLPAVRLTDGQPYKKRDASSAFRKSTGCIQCHATMDQLAAGGRGLLLANITRDNSSNTNPQFRLPYQRKTDKGNAAVWPEIEDALYSRRPPKGALYFRSYTGDLVHEKFSNLSQLAAKILETDDYYACVAKKYYEHFTGVSVSLADINDPFSTVSLNEQDLFHRKQVVKFGENLRETKSTYKLVEEILKSRVYQSEGFTLLGGN